MLNAHEDCFICDLAEVYHVYDMEAYPVGFIATLLSGLREDSRTIMSLTGRKLSLKQTVDALTYDAINLILWSKTEDGRNNANRPKRLIDILNDKEDKDEEIVGYEDEDELLSAFNRIARG